MLGDTSGINKTLFSSVSLPHLLFSTCHQFPRVRNCEVILKSPRVLTRKVLKRKDINPTACVPRTFTPQAHRFSVSYLANLEANRIEYNTTMPDQVQDKHGVDIEVGDQVYTRVRGGRHEGEVQKIAATAEEAKKEDAKNPPKVWCIPTHLISFFSYLHGR